MVPLLVIQLVQEPLIKQPKLAIIEEDLQVKLAAILEQAITQGQVAIR